MKFHTAIFLASLCPTLLLGVFLMQPFPSIEQRVRLQVSVADQAMSDCRFRPSIVVNVKKSGKMLDFNGKSLTKTSLRAALDRFAEDSPPTHIHPRVTVRADRNTPVAAIRLIYDEAVSAGYATMNFRVYASDRPRF